MLRHSLRSSTRAAPSRGIALARSLVPLSDCIPAAPSRGDGARPPAYVQRSCFTRWRGGAWAFSDDAFSLPAASAPRQRTSSLHPATAPRQRRRTRCPLGVYPPRRGVPTSFLGRRRQPVLSGSKPQQFRRISCLSSPRWRLHLPVSVVRPARRATWPPAGREVTKGVIQVDVAGRRSVLSGTERIVAWAQLTPLAALRSTRSVLSL